MPYDTMLRPDDPLDRRFKVTYGSPPSGVTREQAASEDAAKRFARRRVLMGLAGGLGAGIEAGGGFFGNLLRGASGSLGGTLQANQMQHEEERQAIRDQADQQRYQENQARLMQALGLQGRGVETEQRRLDETIRHNLATEGGQTATEPSRIRELGFLESRGVPNALERIFPPPRPEMNEPLVQVQGEDGLPMWVPRSQAVGKHVVRERSLIKGQERTALAFYNRALDSERAIAPLEEKIASMPLPQQFQLRFAPNVAQTSEQQVYRQAQRAFTEARLRKESGAAIPTSEYVNDSKTYFAQPGDSPETIKRKREARQMVLNGLKFSSGQAYEEYYGEPNTSPLRGNTNGGGADIIWTRDANGKLVRQ